jgi:hypothetical protein
VIRTLGRNMVLAGVCGVILLVAAGIGLGYARTRRRIVAIAVDTRGEPHDLEEQQALIYGLVYVVGRDELALVDALSEQIEKKWGVAVSDEQLAQLRQLARSGQPISTIEMQVGEIPTTIGFYRHPSRR